VKAVFVDTSGWVAVTDGEDGNHVQMCAARNAALEAGQLLVTTDFVVDETLTFLRAKLGVEIAEQWWHAFDRSPRVRWERIEATRFEKAREMFFQYRDKNYSFTDCTSFVVMREAGLTHALTTDRHFRQMGFSVLPASRLRR